MSEDEQNKVYNTKGLAPNLSMPVKGDASSTTKSAVAAGTIDIRENPTQDISALSRDTVNSLNELGRIFDKAKIEERQELAAVFGEEAFRLLHNMKDDGSGRKIAAHAIIGGIMSQITGAGFASGAIGAGLNEALIKALDGKDPGTAQIVSAIIGAAAAKVAGGNAQAGASAAASGTKWNYFLMEHPNFHGVGALAQHILKREDGKELSSEEILRLIQGMNSIFSEEEPERANAQNRQSENVKNYPKAISYLTHLGITKNSAIQFFKEYNNLLRKQDWNIWEMPPNSINVTVDKNTGKTIDTQRQPSLRQYTAPIQAYPPAVFTGENLVLPKIPNQSKKSDDQGFDLLRSTITNIVSEKANLFPIALQYAGYHKNLISAYLKTGGAIGYTWMVVDMKHDWSTYSDTNLAKAWGTDLTPLVSSLTLGAAGARLGNMVNPGMGVFLGGVGTIGGGILGDWIKYEMRKGIPKDSKGE